MNATISQELWGTTTATESQTATDVLRHRLSTTGISIEVITYGAHLVSVEVPDVDGAVSNVVLSLPDLAAYEDPERNPSIGATVGRFANRIAGGRFELDGSSYELATNDGANHLHGGPSGFERLVWESASMVDGDSAELELTLLSPDGHEGYPGEVAATTTYRIEPNKLVMTHRATCTAATPVNLTNHAYWNLGSDPTVAGHMLQLDADRYLPVEAMIPTGEIADVALTPMDLRAPRLLADVIDQMSGFDHCFVIPGDLASPCASLSEATSGRSMLVSTDQVGLQVYTGNYLGEEFVPFGALCLEAQGWPDSPNKPEFPSTILRPGEQYESTTVHAFGH
ncbi:MAG: aldose epimerase family protein [Acidimicrobiales bacterium]